MEYVWLSVYVKLDYLTYINLLKIFKNAKHIYISSKDKDKFLKMLKFGDIYINYKVYSKLIDSQLKIKAYELFSDLNKSNIKVINIHSRYYPKQLINIFNPPLTIFAYGNLSLLKKKSIYVYNSNNFSVNGKRIYNEFCEYMSKNDISIISDTLVEYSNIIYLPYIKKINKKDILVISDRLEESSYVNYEYITGISDSLFIAESNYNIKVATIVDIILEQGKDILVVPGSIYNKESYFSNYLIKDGAICITSKTDLLNYFK